MVLQYHSLRFLSKMGLINQLASSPTNVRTLPYLYLAFGSWTAASPVPYLFSHFWSANNFFLQLWQKSAETSLPCKKAAAVTTAKPWAPRKATGFNIATRHVSFQKFF